MYTCSLHIYFAGHPCHAFDVIKKMPALEHFTHIFSESDEAEASLSAKADVIIADLSRMNMPRCRFYCKTAAKTRRLFFLRTKNRCSLSVQNRR